MKRALILFLLVSYSLILPAQSWEVLNEQFLDFYEKEEFDKAIATGEKARLAAKKEFGEQSANHATSLYNLASVWFLKKEYKKAEPLYLLAKNIQQKVLGEMNDEYASTINDLASLYVETKQYAKAEPLYLQAKTISEQTLGKNHSEYIAVIENLATLYDEMKQFDKAEQFYEEAINYYKTKPDNKEDYEYLLDALAWLHDKTGQFTKAISSYSLLLHLREELYGKISTGYATTLNRLALANTAMGDYTKAEPLYIENLAIRKEVYGENHPEYASALSNLGSHYVDRGLYEKAGAFFIEAADIAEQNPDKSNTEYITYVNNYAMLHVAMGKYDIAEPLLVRIAEVRKKINGEKDPEYALALNNLGSVYFKTGQYDKAQPLFKKALEITGKTLGQQTPEYASGLNNLGLLLAASGQLKDAEKNYLLSKATWEKLQLTAHPDYASLLDNLASLYNNQGKADKSKQLYLLALGTRKKAVGEMHPDYATSLNNLGYYYMEAGLYDSSLVFFLKAKEIIEKTAGREHASYGVISANISELYMRMKRFDKAETGLMEANKILLQQVGSTFTVLSEKEKNEYLSVNTGIAETNNSLLHLHKQASPEMVKSAFHLELALKSASLADTKNLLQLLQSSADNSTRTLYELWIANKRLLAKQYVLPEQERRKDITEIEYETEQAEKTLAVGSSEFRSGQSALQIKPEDVGSSLKTGEAAVEFVRFHLRAGTANSDTVLYAAYIISDKEASPVFVTLCEEKKLQQLIDSAGKNAAAMVSSLYRGLERGSRNTALGKDLYNLIWQPLEPYLKGVKKVNYSPAGKLYGIALHALPVDSTTLLMDKYELNQYTSTRQVALGDKTVDNKKPGSAALFGDARFTIDSSILAGLKKQNENISNVYTPSNRGTRGSLWTDLPGTAEEIKKIKQLFEDNNLQTQSFTQANASEENLKALDNKSPQVVHIATHGFFLPEPDKKNRENVYAYAEDPLLRSGLILSGGNHAWSGKTPIEGVEDGIATAYEISQLNLSNTELVVLSACETALGDIKGSEGVFGLQRAFKMAGVKKMIVSLWQVPDKETAELMTSFYSYWLNGKTIEAAFAQAQSDMRKKYSPFYWAAFVLVE